ncbi:MAG: transporter, partial [Thermodesulfovibrionales bacterium]|nr:transporter [Thermodesulfovibrionales bacterium]
MKTTSIKKAQNIFFILLLLFFCLNENALATEGGGGAYPNGAEDFMAGAVPPPGTYFLNYLTYYKADKFMDNNGKSSIKDFDLKVTANVFRLLHVTNTKILDGNWAIHIFVPVLNVDVSLPFGSKSKKGLGDIIIDP